MLGHCISWCSMYFLVSVVLSPMTCIFWSYHLTKMSIRWEIGTWCQLVLLPCFFFSIWKGGQAGRMPAPPRHSRPCKWRPTSCMYLAIQALENTQKILFTLSCNTFRSYMAKWITLANDRTLTFLIKSTILVIKCAFWQTTGGFYFNKDFVYLSVCRISWALDTIVILQKSFKYIVTDHDLLFARPHITQMASKYVHFKWSMLSYDTRYLPWPKSKIIYMSDYKYEQLHTLQCAYAREQV